SLSLHDALPIFDGLLMELVREVVLEGLVVDLPLTGTGSDTDAGHGLLATTGTGARAGRGGNIGVGRLVGLGGVLGGEFLRVLLVILGHVFDAGGLDHGSPRAFL